MNMNMTIQNSNDADQNGLNKILIDLNIDLQPLEPFNHQLLLQPIEKLSSHLSPSINSDQPLFHGQNQPEEVGNNPWIDLYFELINLQKNSEKDQVDENSPKLHSGHDHDNSNLVFSWDSFNRPICSRIPLRYQTPYPIEESLSVWEAILSASHLNLSSPIKRSNFVVNFFRHSIGLKTDAPSNKLVFGSSADGQSRVYGQTDHSTHSINRLASAAFDNLSMIEKFAETNSHSHNALSTSLGILIDWTRIEIMECFESESILNELGLLSTSLILEPIFNLLTALTDLVQTCEQNSQLMQEDAVYQHLDYHISNRSSSLIQVIFSWLLDKVCVAFLHSWQTWLGIDIGLQKTPWGDEKDRLYQSLWSRYGIQPVSRLSNHDRLGLGLDELDQIGPPPLSYSFKPDRIPAFFPVNLAESIFKAGVSLRILRRSSPFHPICLTYSVPVHDQCRWPWTTLELEKVREAFSALQHDTKTQIAAWRHGISLSDPSTVPPRSPGPSKTSLQDIEQPLDIDRFLKEINAGLKSSDTHICRSRYQNQSRQGLIKTLEERLKWCQASSPGILSRMELPSLGVLTDLTVLELLRSRAHDIDRCILSFFLIDLDLVNHLSILNQFMFGNDVLFNQRLSNALFHSNSSDPHMRRPVGVSERLLRRGTWPPGGFDLSFALRTVILDSVALDQRPASYRDSSAWDEIEDRLSFTIRPEIEKDSSETTYNAESIGGFGFLVLDFKPPEALRLVLGPEVLGQYQIVNKYLMKLLRLQSMMNSNWRMIRPRRLYDNVKGLQERYVHEVDILATNSQKLLDGLVSYTWEIAIGRNWKFFITKIEQAKEVIQARETWIFKKKLSNLKPAEEVEQRPSEEHEKLFQDLQLESIEELVKLHRLTLTEISTNLFLRSKQEVYLNLLNRSVFETIIEFTIHLEEHYRRLGVKVQANDDEGAVGIEKCIKTVQEIKSKQYQGIQRLIKSLDQLHQRSAHHQSHHSRYDLHKTGFLKELLVRLDFNSFYFDHH